MEKARKSSASDFSTKWCHHDFSGVRRSCTLSIARLRRFILINSVSLNFSKNKRYCKLILATIASKWHMTAISWKIPTQLQSNASFSLWYRPEKVSKSLACTLAKIPSRKLFLASSTMAPTFDRKCLTKHGVVFTPPDLSASLTRRS